jgi:hypothetical protein
VDLETPLLVLIQPFDRGFLERRHALGHLTRSHGEFLLGDLDYLVGRDRLDNQILDHLHAFNGQAAPRVKHGGDRLTLHQRLDRQR